MPRLRRNVLAATFPALAPVLLVALVLAGPVPVRGQDRSGEETVFEGETTVIAVEVPVQVVHDGEPVRGLGADDFRVWDGEERVDVTGFEVVDLTVAGPAAGGGKGARSSSREPAAPTPRSMSHSTAPGEIPLAGRRHFLFLFDLSLTEPGLLPRAVEGARRFVRGGLHPSDLVGVAFYSARRGISMPLGFTPDRGQVQRVLDAFDVLLDGKDPPEGSALDDGGLPDPLGLTAGGWKTALVEVGRAAGYQTSDFAEVLGIRAGGSPVSRSGNVPDSDAIAHSAAFMEQAFREQRAAQVADLVDGIRELAQGLRSVDGPKHLVLFSQGFDDSLLNPMGSSSQFVGGGGGSWILRKVDQMTDELRRTGWVLDGADVGGVHERQDRAFGSSLKGGLFFLANETGGILIENANELSRGLEDVLTRTSVTYVLTFQAEGVPLDGSFRPLRVEVEGLPRRARVVHREGYHAPRPAGERDPFEERARAAARLLAGHEVGALGIEARATALGYEEVAGGGVRAQVPILVEVPARVLVGAQGTPTADGSVPTEIYVYAFSETGKVADHFAQELALDGADLARRVAGERAGGEIARDPARGLKATGRLELAPGGYEVRILVRNPATGADAVRILDLDLPDPAAGPRLLPPVFVQQPEERWVTAMVSRDSSGSGDSDPFVVEGKQIAPAAAPELAPGEAARLLLPGVGLTGEGVRLVTRVSDGTGRTVEAAELEILGRRPPAAGQPDLLVGRLDSSGLAPGTYRLEVTIADREGEGVAAPFRVVPR